MESRLEPVRHGFALNLQVFRAAFKDNTLPAKAGARAPARALTWRGGSPRQAEDSPACDRRLLRRGDTGWGAAGGELPVRNLDSVYSRNTEALSKPGFVGNNSLICLNGKPHRASVLHVRLDDHFPPSSTPAFSRARRRTGSTLRPGPAVLRSAFAHRFGPLYPALRMVRQRCSTVSAHLVGACVHRQARLSVSYHQRAH